MNDGNEMIPFVTSVLNGRNRFNPSFLNAVNGQLTAAQVFQETFNTETCLPHVQVAVGDLSKYFK